MDEQLDANAIIDKLSNQIAGLNRELAIQQVRNDGLQEVIDKQEELIDAYKEKEGDIDENSGD